MDKKVTYLLLATMVDYNPDTGVLTWKEGYGGRYSGCKAGHLHDKNHGRLKIKYKNKRYFCHIICWIIGTGAYPENQIDHINGDPMDNRLCNLRDVDHVTNARNTTRVKLNRNIAMAGVSRTKYKWLVMCCKKKIGSYDCLGQAIKARKAEEQKLGGFTERHSK